MFDFSFFPEGFRFEQPVWFCLLIGLPLLAFLKSAAGRQAAVRFSSLHLLGKLGKSTRHAAGYLGMFLTFLTLTAGITALARPQSVHTDEKVEESGVEIFIVLDLSLSMSIRDMRIGNEMVDRLSVAKKVTREFIQNRPSDRIGFVVFSGRPYLASPLTLDKNWLLETLDRIGFNQTPDMGTAIGSGIATAAKRLTSRQAKGKTIILVTDGANNSGKISPKEAAMGAATLGIKIYTVAIGTHGYHVVPVPTPRGDHVGVRQEFDEETLKLIASTTGGRFYHAKDAHAMQDIFREIDQLEKTRLNVRKTVHVDELYHWPLWSAVACALTGLVLGQTFLRRFP